MFVGDEKTWKCILTTMLDLYVFSQELFVVWQRWCVANSSGKNLASFRDSHKFIMMFWRRLKDEVGGVNFLV